MGGQLGAAGPHRRQHSAKEALWAGTCCTGLLPMQIDASGGSPFTGIVPVFRFCERKVSACSPAAS